MLDLRARIRKTNLVAPNSSWHEVTKGAVSKVVSFKRQLIMHRELRKVTNSWPSFKSNRKIQFSIASLANADVYIDMGRQQDKEDKI